MNGLRITGMTAGTLCVLLLTSGDAAVRESELDPDSARVRLEADAPSRVNGPEGTTDKAVSDGRSERHARPKSDEAGSDDPTECLRRETVRADVDGDDLPDLVYHDFSQRQGAMVGVCTARGETDQIAGLGQAETLYIIDIEPDGQDEIFFGATGMASEGLNVAIFVSDGLRRVHLAGGRPLYLERGYRNFHGDMGLAYGCEDTVGVSDNELTQVVVTRRGRTFHWTKASYDLQRDRAVLVNNESGERRARGDVAVAARRLTSECRIKSDS